MKKIVVHLPHGLSRLEAKEIIYFLIKSLHAMPDYVGVIVDVRSEKSCSEAHAHCYGFYDSHLEVSSQVLELVVPFWKELLDCQSRQSQAAEEASSLQPTDRCQTTENISPIDNDEEEEEHDDAQFGEISDIELPDGQRGLDGGTEGKTQQSA
jgi:hypothetical protein